MSEYRDSLDNISNMVRELGIALKKVNDWWNNHRDGIDTILSGFQRFAKWYKVAKKLIDNQIVFTDIITGVLVNEINSSEDIESLIESYYLENNGERISKLLKRCYEAKQLEPYKELFSQIQTAYIQNHYHLACVGLFSITDGLLSDVSEKTGTNYKERLKVLSDKIDKRELLTEMDERVLYVYFAIRDFDKSIFANSGNFSKDEPDGLNRHWSLHGRTKRDFKVLDFIKILLWIDALILLDNYEK